MISRPVETTPVDVSYERVHRVTMVMFWSLLVATPLTVVCAATGWIVIGTILCRVVPLIFFSLGPMVIWDLELELEEMRKKLVLARVPRARIAPGTEAAPIRAKAC